MLNQKGQLSSAPSFKSILGPTFGAELDKLVIGYDVKSDKISSTCDDTYTKKETKYSI